MDARNQADSTVHMVRKALTEHGDKIGADEKAKIEAALKAAEEAMKGDDKDAIEAKTRDLAQPSQKLGEQMYAQAGAGAQAGSGQPNKRAATSRTKATWSTPSSKRSKTRKVRPSRRERDSESRASPWRYDVPTGRVAADRPRRVPFDSAGRV